MRKQQEWHAYRASVGIRPSIELPSAVLERSNYEHDQNVQVSQGLAKERARELTIWIDHIVHTVPDVWAPAARGQKPRIQPVRRS